MKFIEKWLVKKLTRNLLAALTPEDILTVTSRGWLLRGRKLTPEEVEALKDEARSLKESVLWDLMRKEVQYLANNRMFEQSAMEGNSVFGRAMLYNLQILEQFIERLRNL